MTMQGMYNQPNLSSESMVTRTSTLLTSESSSSGDGTEAGLGTLSGRAVMAVGELFLRGMESVAMRQKLNELRRVFPHDDRRTGDEMEGHYRNLIELSRPNLYKADVRKQALGMLMAQVARRQTDYLIKCLLKWPHVEIGIILCEMIVCMPSLWLPSSIATDKIYREIFNVYLSHQPSGEPHPAGPLIDFMAKMIQTPATAAALGSGVLDMFVCLYVCNFSCEQIPENVRQRFDSGHDSIFRSCCDALLSICQVPSASAILSQHPITIMWPHMPTLSSMLRGGHELRCNQWRRLKIVVVARRMTSIRALLELSLKNDLFIQVDLLNIYIDILEFTKTNRYNADIAGSALKCLFRCIDHHELYGTSLNLALSTLAQQDRFMVLTRMVEQVSPDHAWRQKLSFYMDVYGIQAAVSSRLHDVDISSSLTLLTPHTRAEYDPLHFCLKNTRRGVLRLIKDWAESPDSRRILWLWGMAGAGKSTIASSSARWMDGSDPADRLLNTVSWQLCRRFPIFAQCLREVLDFTPSVRELQTVAKFEALLNIPFQTAHRRSPFRNPIVLILDGLDQCGNASSRQDLRLVLRQLPRLPPFVKILVTSSSVRDLKLLFAEMETEGLVYPFSLSDVPRYSIVHDIQRYVESRSSSLARIRKEYAIDWPGNEKRVSLAKQAGRLFLWASSAMESIEHDDNPESRLDTILKGQYDSEPNAGFQRVYKMYKDELERVYMLDEHTLRQQKFVLGFIVRAKRNVSLDTIRSLLGVQQQITTSPRMSDGIDDVMESLASLLTLRASKTDAAPDVGTVRIIHPSFADYVQSLQCPEHLRLDAASASRYITCRCFIRMHESLQRNICRLTSPSSPNAQVHNLQKKLSKYLPDDLQYACTFWAYHLSDSPANDDEIYTRLTIFLAEDLRNWLEVLSLLGRAGKAPDILIKAQQWVESRVIDHSNLSPTIKSHVPLIIANLSRVVSVAGHSHVFEMITNPIHPESIVRDLRRGAVQVAPMAFALGQEFPAGDSQGRLHLFRTVVGTLIVAKKSLSPHAIQNLLWSASPNLHTQTNGGDDVAGVIQKVHSTLTSQQKQGTSAAVVQLTLGKFMASNYCPTHLRIDIPSCRRQLSIQCFARMRESLEYNMCQLEDPSTPKIDILDLRDRLKHFVPEDLQYACGFWALHLSETSPDDHEMYHLLKSFFCNDVRNWLEFVCLVETAERAVSICDQAKTWVESCSEDADNLSILINNLSTSIEKQLMLESFSASHCHTFMIPPSPRTSAGISQSILFSPLCQISSESAADEHQDAVGMVGGAVASALEPGDIVIMANRQSTSLPLERDTATLEASGPSAHVRFAPLMSVEFPSDTISDETSADYWFKSAPWVMESPRGMSAIEELAELDDGDGDGDSDAGSFHSAEEGE